MPLEKCGYLPDEIATASPEDMNIYYSVERQAQYGVVGIEIGIPSARLYMVPTTISLAVVTISMS